MSLNDVKLKLRNIMIERGEKNVKMEPGKVVRDLEKTQRCTELERSSLEAKLVMSERICEELDKRTLWMEEEIVKLRREKLEVEEKLGKSEGRCAELDKRIIEMEEKMEKSCRNRGELKPKEIVVEELQQENNELRVKRMDAAQLYRPRMLKVKAKLVNSGGSGGIGLSMRGKSSKVKKMTKQVVFLILTIYWAVAGLQTSAITDVLEVQTLQGLFRSLNCPMQLKHWKADTGDPCEETWMGVKCLGSSLITLDLHGLELTGNLRIELSNFKRLKHLDLGSNNIEGSILYNLPPKATHLILADNKFSGTIPYSIGEMKHLHHLNLSHNLLSGSLVDMFYGLQNLEKMDLSFNNFTGRLPISFICLTNLIGLFLQNNQFTGSVMFLANLSLTDLNIEDNYFSGLIPESFQNIINLRIAGNMFVTDYGPWNVPINTMPREKYISTTSAAAYLITIESHPSQSVVHKKRKPALKIVMLIVVFTLAATFSFSILFVTRKRHRRNHRRSVSPNDPVSPDESVRSQSPYANQGTGYRSTSGGSSPNTSLSFSLSPSPPITTSSDFTVVDYLRQPERQIESGVELFHFSALRDATNNFGSDCLIEDSDWWRVYKGSFVEGKVYAVKELRNSLLVRTDDESLEEISKLQLWRHPNLVSMIGYCVHEGKIYIISDLVPSKSLASLLYDDPLHLPRLEWRERMVIALQVARGLEFMHQNDALVKNLSALTVFVGDCLRTVIGDVWIPSMFYMHSPKPWLSPGECYVGHADPYKSIRGYDPPESLYYFVFSKEWDVYSFGILFLVLITGKAAYDDDVGFSFDMELLIKRVRPTIEGGLPESMFELVDNDMMVEFPDLERALDLVYKCTNERMELRPTMSEVVEILQEFI